MSVSIEIIPHSECLEMFGDADASSVYSLSGHVAISLTSASSYFTARRTVRLLLKSLIVTFEGQSELVTADGDYSSMRLCSVEKELVIAEPVDLSNEGSEGSRTCTWNVVFDLPVSGWLPPTSLYGCATPKEGGTRYGLYATARFENISEEMSATPWLFSALCMPFRSTTRTAHATRRRITLKRLVQQPVVSDAPDTLFPMITYAVDARLEHPDAERDNSKIPLNILNALRVQASVAQYADVESDRLPFAIRLRADGLDDSDAQRLRLEGFEVEVEQAEKYRFSPRSDVTSQYPVPGRDMQPPRRPLREVHSLSALDDLGVVRSAMRNTTVTRTFSIVPGDQCAYKLGGDGYVFEEDNGHPHGRSWFTIDTKVPIERSRRSESLHWTGEQTLRTSVNSPLFTIRHCVNVTLTCTYDIPGSLEVATERLSFSVPVRFAHVAPAHRHPCSVCPPSTITSSTTAPPAGVPYMPPSLPPYSQLFDSNGERKVDYSVPLPLYTPRASLAAAACTSQDSASDAYAETKEVPQDAHGA